MRAPSVLIALAVLALAAVGWLVLAGAPPEPVQADPVRARVPDPVSAAPAAPDGTAPGLPRVEAPGSTVLEPSPRAVASARPDAPRLPRTTQSLHGRVALPAGGSLRFADVTARVRDADGLACGPTIPEPDGRLVLELDRPIERGFVELLHPACLPLRIGEFDVGYGVRRDFGLARPEPGETRSVQVRTPEGVPAEGARVWVLPAPGRAAGPLEPVLTDAGGSATLVLPLGGPGLFARHGRAVASLPTLPPRSAAPIELRLGGGAAPLAGRILDRATGRGLSGASVDVLVGASVLFGVRADVEGRFDLGEGYDAAVALRISAPGFETRRVEGPAQLWLGPDERVFQLGRTAGAVPGREDSETPPPVDLSVRVTGTDDDPIEGATVELRRYAVPGGSPAGTAEGLLARAATDAAGVTSLAAPREKGLFLLARAAGHVQEWRPVGNRYPTEGERFEFALDPGVTVTGRVVDAGGRPVPGCPIRIDDGSPRLGTTTDLDGRFALPATRARSLVVQALAVPGFEPLGRSEPRTLDLTLPSRPLLELVLAPGNADR